MATSNKRGGRRPTNKSQGGKRFEAFLQVLRDHPAITCLSTVGLFLTLVEGFSFLLGGPIWPTAPEVTAQDTISDDPKAVLPFHISNKSKLFPITRAKLYCYINLAYAMDADRKTILLRDATLSGPDTSIAPDTNFRCDEGILKIGSAGQLIIGVKGGPHLTTRPDAFRGPLTPIKLCVMVIGSYNVFGIKRTFRSEMWQWPADPDHHQWIKGPIDQDEDQEKWIPEGSTVGAAYGLRRVAFVDDLGRTHYTPDALLCDHVPPQ